MKIRLIYTEVFCCLQVWLWCWPSLPKGKGLFCKFILKAVAVGEILVWISQFIIRLQSTSFHPGPAPRPPALAYPMTLPLTWRVTLPTPFGKGEASLQFWISGNFLVPGWVKLYNVQFPCWPFSSPASGQPIWGQRKSGWDPEQGGAKTWGVTNGFLPLPGLLCSGPNSVVAYKRHELWILTMDMS